MEISAGPFGAFFSKNLQWKQIDNPSFGIVVLSQMELKTKSFQSFLYTTKVKNGSVSEQYCSMK